MRTTAETMARFNAAFLNHDPTLLEDLVAEDCVIENTVPAPDGARYEGRAACLGLWRQVATTPGTGFDVEAVEVFGDRAILRWRFHWGEDAAASLTKELSGSRLTANNTFERGNSTSVFLKSYLFMLATARSTALVMPFGEASSADAAARAAASAASRQIWCDAGSYRQGTLGHQHRHRPPRHRA